MNKLIIIFILLPFLFSCSIFYKNVLNQGSVISKVNVDTLKLDMNKKEVEKILGSPSIIDPFHNNRWDYINHSTLEKKNNVNYHLILVFENDKLTDINVKGSVLTNTKPKNKLSTDTNVNNKKLTN